MTTAAGASPEGPLIQEEDGSLIGTAPTGGTLDGGTLFKTSLAGDVTVLHHFEETSGHNPQYGVIRGSDGDLYGGTYHQYGVATIYRVTYLPPEILSISPAQAPPGAAITITRKHFAKTSRVQFGNLDAPSFSLDSNTQITAVVPAGFRAGTIAITNPLGQFALSHAGKAFTPFGTLVHEASHDAMQGVVDQVMLAAGRLHPGT